MATDSEGLPQFVVAADSRGTSVLRLDATTGSVDWRVPAPSVVEGHIRIVRGLAVAVGRSGLTFFALDARTGRLVWAKDYSDVTWRASGARSYWIQTDGERLYFAAQRNHGVVAADPLSGEVLWSHYDEVEGTEAGAHYVTRLASIGNRLLTNYGWLDPRTGRTLGRFKTEDSPNTGVDFGPISADAAVVIRRGVSSSNTVERIDPMTFKRLWQHEMKPYGDACGDADSRSVVVAGSASDGNSRVGVLLSLDAESGRPAWRIQFQPVFPWSCPVLDGERIYLVEGSGRAGGSELVVARDRGNGQQVWSYESATPVSGTVSAGPLLFIHSAEAVIAIDRQTGAVRWRTELAR